MGLDEFAKMDVFFVVTTVVVGVVGILLIIVLYRIWRILGHLEYFAKEIKEEASLVRGDIAKVRSKLERGTGIVRLIRFGKEAYAEFTAKRKRRGR